VLLVKLYLFLLITELTDVVVHARVFFILYLSGWLCRFLGLFLVVIAKNKGAFDSVLHLLFGIIRIYSSKKEFKHQSSLFCLENLPVNIHDSLKKKRDSQNYSKKGRKVQTKP